MSGVRRLENADEDKFWETWIKDDVIHMYRFGKIGSSGQLKLKRFKTREEAEAELEEKLQQKIGEGYEEIGGVGGEEAEEDGEEEAAPAPVAKKVAKKVSADDGEEDEEEEEEASEDEADEEESSDDEEESEEEEKSDDDEEESEEEEKSDDDEEKSEDEDSSEDEESGGGDDEESGGDDGEEEEEEKSDEDEEKSEDEDSSEGEGDDDEESGGGDEEESGGDDDEESGGDDEESGEEEEAEAEEEEEEEEEPEEKPKKGRKPIAAAPAVIEEEKPREIPKPVIPPPRRVVAKPKPADVTKAKDALEALRKGLGKRSWKVGVLVRRARRALEGVAGIDPSKDSALGAAFDGVISSVTAPKARLPLEDAIALLHQVHASALPKATAHWKSKDGPASAAESITTIGIIAKAVDDPELALYLAQLVCARRKMRAPAWKNVWERVEPLVKDPSVKAKMKA